MNGCFKSLTLKYFFQIFENSKHLIVKEKPNNISSQNYEHNMHKAYEMPDY